MRRLRRRRPDLGVGIRPHPRQEAGLTRAPDQVERPPTRGEALAGLGGDPAADVDASLAALGAAHDELRARYDRLVEQHEATRARLGRYEDLFDHAPDAYVLSDGDGVILQANKRASELFRRKPRSLVGTGLATFVPPAQRRAFGETLARLRAGEALGDVDFTIRHGHRAFALAEAHLAPVREPGGISAIRWVLRDVTRDREWRMTLEVLNDELEARVQDRTEKLEAVLRSLPIGVIVTDANGDVVQANDVAHRVLGGALTSGARERLASYAAYRADGARYAAEEWPLMRALAGETVTGELIAMRIGDADTVTLETSAAPIRARDGALRGAVVAFRDVTLREAREQALREFAVNAAHELLTPVSAISAAVEVLQGGAKEARSERDRFLEHIERQTERLTGLTRALLTLARVQSRQETAPVAVVPLAPVVERLARDLPVREGVELRIDCKPHVAALVNESLVEQALSTLLDNAARYTKRGRIAVTARLSGRTAVVTVSDTGTGIPRDVQERMYERFARAETDSGGFGLGLAIARQAVDALGGELAIDSTVGVGTTARVTLAGARLQ